MSDIEKVKKLREATGAGFKDCNLAIKESKGDLDKAVEILRVKGISKASKKMTRDAKEGLVERYSGKIIARSANNVTLEGREMVRVALAEFPDIETAKNCYNSEEYVEARKHLENNATREHIIFEGM